MKRKTVPFIFWVILFSFLIRLLFFLFSPPEDPLMRNDDDGYYQKTGFQILRYLENAVPLMKEFVSGRLFHGGGNLEKYGLEIPWGAIKRGPVYPLFLAVVAGLFGPGAFPVFVLQALLMALSTGLLYSFGKEIVGKEAALLAAILMGAYPPLIFITEKIYQDFR